MRLAELADRLTCQLEGDGDLEVYRVAGIEQACVGDLTFVANPRYAPLLRTTRATAVIVGPEAPPAPCATLRSLHPYLAFADAVGLFVEDVSPPAGVDPLASVADDATVSADVSIGPFVRIGAGASVGKGTVIHSHSSVGPGVVIGESCLIHSHVAVREHVVLGARVVVQDGAVIGSDGFGFARRPDGSHQKIPQAGRVVIEDEVEIGANTTIDRPAVGETRVKAGAKVDNLVQIAHGVTVGHRSLLAAQVGIAGSTTIEDDVVLAGQVGVAGHLTVGQGARATAQTGIPNSVSVGAFVSGYPAIDNRDWLKSSVIFRRLPELKQTIASLERRIVELEEALARTAGVREP